MSYGRDLDLMGEHQLSRYQGTIRFMGEFEIYAPDWAARQFGRVQSIPVPLSLPTGDSHRKATSQYKGYRLEYPSEDYHWADRQGHLWDIDSVTATIPTGRWECAAGFIDWYLEHCHPCVLPSTRPSPLPVVDHSTTPITDRAARDEAIRAELQRFLQRGDGMTHQEVMDVIDRFYGPDRDSFVSTAPM